jgi:hypothetical protein
MTSQAVLVPSAAYRKLPFFPTSFPDETLYSRVSRYHRFRAERKDEITFIELFRETGLKIDFSEAAPAALRVLASLIPGEPLVLLGDILRQNTFVPFLAPLVTEPTDPFPNAEFGCAKACLSCLVQDEQLFGSPYLRRSHQLPAVTACWQHGVKLIDACPDCGSSFAHPGKFVRAPLAPCRCGWYATSASTAEPAPQSLVDFAIHAHALLDQRSGSASLTAIVIFFLLQVELRFMKAEPSSKSARDLLLDMISQQLLGQRTSMDIAIAAAAVIGSAKEHQWW